MNLHSLIVIHLSLALLLPCASSKTLPKRTEFDREREESENSGQSESLHEAHHHSFKHGTDQCLEEHRKGRANEDGDSDREYAIMYRKKEPVGILQRIRDNYQLLPLNAEKSIPVDVSSIQRNEDAKRGAVEEEEEQGDEGRGEADEAQFADEKYPNIFAKSKVDSSGKNETSRMFEKREVRALNLPPLFNTSALSPDLSSIGTNEDGENMEFKRILHDMGLIEEPHLDKREVALAEDENMALGTNKIDLIKIRGKSEGQAKRRQPKRSEWTSTKHYEQIQYPEPKAINQDQQIEEYINKHLEQVKQDDEREKRSNEIEKQMENQIKERLQKIKEEVRSEIDNLKTDNSEKSEEEDDEASKRENSEEDDGAQRWRRSIISNLMEEETSDLNPVMATDENPISHVRRRRSVQAEEKAPLATTENHFQLRRLLEFSDELGGDQIEDAEKEAPLRRDKKGCMCEGSRGCKCNRHKSYITRRDGSSSGYLDEAPIMDNYPHSATDISGTSSNSKPKHDAESLPPNQEDKRLKEGAYGLDIGPDSYKITADKNGWLQARRKKNSFLDLVAVHGGTPVLDHLISIRERSMLPRMRSKRMAIEEKKPQQLTLGDMSENDLFGALPKKFKGDELARFKRI